LSVRTQEEDGDGVAGGRVMGGMRHICDRCGRPLMEGELRYLAKLEVWAAADPLVVTAEEMSRDHAILREHLIEQSEAMTEEELMRDVQVTREFCLCRRCQLTWLQNPLGGMA